MDIKEVKDLLLHYGVDKEIDFFETYDGGVEIMTEDEELYYIEF